MSHELTDVTGINACLRETPIAIIGLASIFPQAENLHQYWDNIIKEVDCVTDVPPSRWNIDDYYDPDIKAPDKTYCKRGGFIPDIDFNPMEFGLPPNILEVTDVSQLLSLVVAKEAIKDAGYGEGKAFNRAKTGVILGVGGGQKLITPLTTRLQYPIWEKVLKNSGIAPEDREKIIEKMKLAYIPWEENSFPGMLGNVIAGRIANRLDLGGTNCVVDAACAASLAAVKMAVGELTSHHADTMITGGVDTDNSIFMYLSFSKTPAFSKQGDIRPFDENSDGMIIGEGVGMLVLKRLADAERDNDRIYAVIKGIGSSSDGKFKSIYAPRASGQAVAVNRAYQDAGFSSDSVGLIEAHGTGTSAGDPTEFDGLNEAFSQKNQKKQHIALGTVKSQIGHTKAAAGAASLIKTALALHHKILPPTINVSRPNPKMDIENSPFYLNTKTRPWIRAEDAPPRRAGVSAFGFGGTNFHFALEEYTQEHTQAYRLHSVAQPIFLAAQTPAQLLTDCEQQLALLHAEGGEAHYQALVNASAQIKIPATSARIGFVAESSKEAGEYLDLAIKLLQKNGQAESWEHPKGIHYRQSGIATDGKVVALFPGQGSQYLEMGRELTQNFPPLRRTYSRIDNLFTADKKEPLSNVVFPIPGFDPAEKAARTKSLERTEYAQPAIGTFSFGLYKILQQAGFKPDFAAGHSFGELTALWAGDVINDQDYFFLIKARGEAMAPPNNLNFDTGAMLAVKGNIEQLQAEVKNLPGATIANYNSNTQVVLAGPKTAMQNAQQQLETKGYFVTPLPVSAAFHTPLVGHAQQPFAQAIKRTTFNNPTIPVYTNSTGQPYPNNSRAIQIALEEHILKPVLFKQEIENIHAAGGTIFVEIGPKSVLTNLVKNILAGKPHLAIAVNPGRKKSCDRYLREAYAQLRVAGLSLHPVDSFEIDRGASQNGKKPRMTVKLNGNNYVSDKTRSAFENALQDGHKVTTPDPKPVAVTAIASVLPKLPVVASTIPVAAKNSNGHKKIQIPTVKPLNVTAVAANIEPKIKPVSAPVVAAITALSAQTNRNGATELNSGPVLPVTKPAASVSSKSSNGRNQTGQNGHNLQGKTNMQIENRTPNKAQPAASTKATRPSLSSLEKSVALLHDHQSETLRVHEEYLKNQESYSQSMFRLLRQVYSKAPADTVEETTPSGEDQVQRPSTKTTEARATESAAAPFNAPALPVPAQSVPQITLDKHAPKAALPPKPVEAAAPAPTVVETPAAVETTAPAAPVAAPKAEPAPMSVPAADARQSAELKQAMLLVVSEKTGYPAEMLELEMDMEADLGIDSIKRVEILGAMQERYPHLPEVNPEELAELRTLGQIVEHMQGAPATVPAVVETPTVVETPAAVETTAPAAPVAAPKAEPAPMSVPAADARQSAELKQAMLLVVSEKTGYPAEMLELEMDMEADLGIDSIKRVEILGAMQERYPHLPEVNPEELAELRILGQIVEHMQGAPATVPAVVETPAPAAPVAAPKAEPAPTSVSAADARQSAELEQAMLLVVSEKTGYPTEMLELEMDMEADLGIDSIKRVEILGAMQERYPHLPEVNPEELAELRTLGQIVEHMQGAPAVVEIPAPVQVNGNSAPNGTTPASRPITAELSQAMLEVVSEKTGYPAEMLELEMDMEADLGIDSIKRVEILGTMQERYPDLPPVNPDELAEIRTLGGIVSHLGKSEPATEAGEATITETINFVAADLPEHTISRNLVRLKPLATPDFLEFALPEKYVCLITDDGTENTFYLAQSLVERGRRVATLSFPHGVVATQAALPDGVTRVTLADLSEAHLQQQLAAISATVGPVGTFIHLNPAGNQNTDAAKAIVKQIFFIAKHLKNSLAEAARQGRASFLTVARLDGEFGLSGTLDFNPVDAGLFGLTKTLNLEWSQVFCRAVDLHPGIAPEHTAQFVLAELHDPNQLVAEAGYGNKGRSTLEAVPVPIDGGSAESGNQITPSSVFVVSGGAKGITAQCVIRLAQQHRCKFILLGRSSINDVDTSWLGDYADEAALKRLIMEHLLATGEKPTPVAVQKLARAINSKQEIESTLEAIRQTGGQAEYLSVNVTDAAVLQQQLVTAAGQLGAITGIIHGAGVLSDKLIEKKTGQDFEAVYSTKVEGMQALLSSVGVDQLEHLVLFSSAAGFYGNTGQADYALSNEILNKTAHLVKQQYPGCHVVSINWGPWDGGMVTPALKRLFVERNIEVIPVDVGTWILANELAPGNRNVVQTVVGGPLAFPGDNQDGVLRSYRVHRILSAEANPFLQDHVIGGHPVLPTVNAIAWIGNVCEQLYPGYTMFACDNYQVLKGIVFDDNSAPAKQYILDIEEVQKTTDEARFKVVVWSNTEAGKMRYHYRAEITLLQSLPDAPIYTGFDSAETQPILKKELYQNGTLFHGPAYQGVERVLNISPEKLTMRCVLPEISVAAQGQFQVQSFNPFIADGQFQSMVIWARHFHNAGSLPLQTRRGEQYRPIPFGETSYVSMEVKSSSESRLVADIITHDAEGRIYAQVFDAEVTISKQLNKLFVPVANR